MFSALLVVPPDAVSVRATLVEEEPVRVLEIAAPVVVTLDDKFPPDKEMSKPFIEPVTTLLLTAMSNIFPDVREPDAR